jgi:ATP adenylyltransferase
MNFSNLRTFIQSKMRMSHIYQPLMLKTLLISKGKASVTKIARSLLVEDASQIEYYENITNNMVGKVLRNHQIVEKEGKDYFLKDFGSLTKNQIEELISLCDEKLEDYIKKRGDKIWSHRKLSEGYISGTIRYEVLKRAKFHCELCGISAMEKALEVDHIIPRKHGGTDESSNFQALCYSCNATKGARDDTDFRKVNDSFRYREDNCLFCNIEEKRVVSENELSFSIEDKFPVTSLHSLIIPKRHIPTYFQLGQSEINAVNQLLSQTKDRLLKRDPQITGFNIGINDGQSAGQTIFHCHIHLIPRRENDVENPKGGVRHLIPGKGPY